MITILYAIIELNNVLGPILYSSHDKQTGDTYAYSERRHSVHLVSILAHLSIKAL